MHVKPHYITATYLLVLTDYYKSYAHLLRRELHDEGQRGTITVASNCPAVGLYVTLL
jgi:hypothetical protein